MNTPTANVESQVVGAKTVLVVDDDEQILRLVARNLTKSGHRVVEASDGVEALRLAAATPVIDLLLTDFRMPEINGLELARRFRAVHPKTPVLMVSGSLDELNGNVQDLDRFAVLAKPFTADELAEKVHTILKSQLASEPACLNSFPNWPIAIKNELRTTR